MVKEKGFLQAKTAFDTLCEMLDEKEWRYQRHDEDLVVTCSAQGEDIPMDFIIKVDPEKLIVSLYSKMSFSVPEDKRSHMAVIISAINYALVDGNFDYDFLSGKIFFRLTSSFRESLISKEVFDYMLMVSCATIDQYNDKLLMFVKDKMTLQEMLAFICK